MRRWARHLLAILFVAILAAGCSGAPGTKNRVDTPAPIDESGSTLIGNPAASLKAQNLAVTGKIVQRSSTAPDAPAGGSIVAGQFTLTWDPPPPPAVVAFYRVERKVNASGTWATIKDSIAPSERELVDYGELGATHYYRVVSFDAAGNFGVSDEVPARISTFCDYSSVWSMIDPLHGCAPFEGLFVLDHQTAYLAGPKLIVREQVRQADPMNPAVAFRTFDIGIDLVLKDVCATDRDHIYAVGYAQAPREKARAAAIAVDHGVVRHIPVPSPERGPLNRLLCEGGDKFTAVGEHGTALACSSEVCAPIAGVDNPSLDKPYAAVWGIPGQMTIIGATLRSLLVIRPNAPPQPLVLKPAAGADDDPAVLDLWGRGGGVLVPEPFGLFAATERGLYRLNVEDRSMIKIDDGRYRRIWGGSLDNFYAAGHGVANFRVAANGQVQKVFAGPPLEFISIHGIAPLNLVYVIDDEGFLYRWDLPGKMERSENAFSSRFSVWHGVLSRYYSGNDQLWKEPRITGIAPVGSRLLAMSYRGYEEGLLLFSPADRTKRPVLPAFHQEDVFDLGPIGKRLIISSSNGLFAAATDDPALAVTKLSDGIFHSAWDCGAGGICALRRLADAAPDEVVLVSAGGPQPVAVLASADPAVRLKQAWGMPPDGLFAIKAPPADQVMPPFIDALLHFSGGSWKEEALPAPAGDAERFEIKFVSAPAGAPTARPILLAKQTAGANVRYALLAYQNGAWSEIDRGDHLRPLVRITAAGDRIFGIPDPPFETTVLVELAPDDRWAVADGKFLFRWTR